MRAFPNCLAVLLIGTCATALADDAARARLLAPEETRVFLDPVAARDVWQTGVRPDPRGTVRLERGEETRLLLAVDEALLIEGPRPPRVWAGDGRGLERAVTLEAAGRDRFLLPPDALGPRSVTLAAPEDAGVDLRLLVTRVEAPPSVLPYTHPVDIRGGERVAITLPGSAGSLPATILRSGETLRMSADGPARLRVRQRALLTAEDAGERVSWTVRATRDGATHAASSAGRIDLDAPRVNGTVEALTQARALYLELPKPDQEIELRASRPLLLEITAAIPEDPRLEGHRHDLHERWKDLPSAIDALSLDLATARRALSEADRRPERAQAGIENLTLSLDPTLALPVAAEQVLSGREDGPVPREQGSLARLLLDLHGLWRDLPFRSSTPVALRTLPVRSPEAVPRQARASAPRHFPVALAGALAAPPPSARLVTPSQPLEFRLPDAPARLRVLVAGGRSGTVLELERDGDEPLALRLTDPLPMITGDARGAALARDRVHALRHDATRPSVVRAIELDLPAGSTPLRVRATDAIAAIGVQARRWRAPDVSPAERRFALEGIDPEQARGALAAAARGAGNAEAPARWRLQLEPEAAWLALRRERFGERLAPRPARLPGPPRETGTTTLEHMTRAVADLDMLSDGEARRAAVDELATRLIEADEAFLAESVLRGAVLFEAPETAAAAARRLEAFYAARARTDALVTLRAARFVREGSAARLCELVDALEAAAETERAARLAPVGPCDGAADDRGPESSAHEAAGRALARRIEADGRLSPETRTQWHQWWATSPGPWHWTSVPAAAVRAGGATRLENPGLGVGVEALSLTDRQPLDLAGPMPGPLRLTLHPARAPTDGRLVAEARDGERHVLDFPRDAASPTLRREDGTAPARSATLDLPHPGPWRLRLADGAAAVVAAQSAPVHASAALAAPPAGRLTLPERSAGSPGQGERAVQVPFRSRAPIPDVRLPDPRVGRAFAVPTAGAPAPGAVVAAGPEQTSAAATPGPEGTAAARARLRTLAARARDADQDPVALHRQAVALVARHPELDEELAALAFRGRWQPIAVVETSAGTATRSQRAAAETGRSARIRAALLNAPTAAQRVLHGDRGIAYGLTDDSAREFVVELVSVRPAYLRARPARVRIDVDGDLRDVTLAPGAFTDRRIRLPAGGGRLGISLLAPEPDTWVAVTLRDAATGTPLDWTLRRRWHVALPDEPVTLRVAGPALLRIQRRGDDGDVTESMRAFDAGAHLLTLTSSDAGPTLFRIARREQLEPEASTGSARAPTSAPTERQAAPVATVERARAWPTLEDAQPASRATWSAGAAFTARTPLEDELTGTREERFTEFSLERRRRRADLRSWDHSHLLTRLREDGEPVLGVGHRRDRRLGRAGLTTRLSADAFLQRPERRDGSSADPEYSVTLRAGIRQRRDIGPRSRHTPELTVFARHLSLDDRLGLDAGSIDQDVFTPFKRDHRYGVRLGDSWRFDPTRDTRLGAGLATQLNERGTPDRIAADFTADQLFGHTAVRAGYRLRHFLDDDDRRSASTVQRLALEIDWRAFDARWRHWSLGLVAVYDLDAEELTASFALRRHHGPGRALLDFRPGTPRFEALRTLDLPTGRREP